MESNRKFKPGPKLKLMNQVNQVLRYHHYAYRTEQSYRDWIIRYVKFHGTKKHPKYMDKQEIDAFLSHLEVNRKVAAATQKQALRAIIFLYRHVLDIEISKKTSLRRAPLRDFIHDLKPVGDIRDVHDFWLRGGYPEPWLKKSNRFHSTWMNQYIDTYLYRDVAKLFPGINENRFRLFVQILAGISGNVVNYSDVARSLGVSQPTVRDYFEIADGTFLWRSIPAYTRNTLKRIGKHPKGYFRDSGLLHYLLRIPDKDLLASHPVMGRSWEGLVIEEIIRNINATGTGFDYYHYRTGGGAEVDLILEGEFGLIPVEIKYAQTVHSKQLRAVKDFIREQNCRFGLVINNDESPCLYNEQIVGIPFAYL